jgi:hypothetical protein
LVDAALAEGVNAACLLYGTTASGKGSALMGSGNSGGLLSTAMDAAFDASVRLHNAMGHNFSFRCSVLDVLPSGGVYDLAADYASSTVLPEAAGAVEGSGGGGKAASEAGSLGSMPSLKQFSRQGTSDGVSPPEGRQLKLQVEQVEGRFVAAGAAQVPVS